MGGFKLGKMTLRSLVSRPATVCYPEERRELYPAMRGHITNDIDTCILCGMCARVCPADALKVDRKAGVWGLNPYKCVQCGYCVRSCPKDCLTMEQESTKVARKLSRVAMHKEVEVAKPKPKRELTPEQEARIAEARARKAAKAAAAEE